MYNIQNYGKMGTKSDGENDWEKTNRKKFPADKAGEKRDAKTGRINPDESDGLAFAFFSRRQRRSRKACRRRF